MSPIDLQELQKQMLEMQKQMATLTEENARLKEANNRPEPIARFNLLPAKDRRSQNSPHYFGSVKIEDKWYTVATWINESNNTKEEYLHNSLTPATEAEAKKFEERDAEFQANAPKLRAGGAQAAAPVVETDADNPFGN